MTPGTRWRFKVGDTSVSAKVEGPIQIHGGDVFDELVVDGWLHLEQMNCRDWWMRVGEHTIWVTVGKDGKAERVTHYGPGEY
jgi:hypothetical protein